MTSPAQHWQGVHTSRDVDAVSWWQDSDDLWLEDIDGLDLPLSAAVLDVGAGSSLLVDALVGSGFTDVTALDIAPAALERIRGRVGDRVDLIEADVLEFRARKAVDLWHDRAVFHFLTDEGDRALYRAALTDALAPDGHAVIATFAPDGPERCSGLPVRRYAPEQIAEELGLRLMRGRRRLHTTPSGGGQPFSVAVLSR